MGKPGQNMAKILIKQFNVDPQRTLMIGDRCNTDILFGNRAGFTTLLVLTGISTLLDIEKMKQSEEKDQQDLIPDYYIDALGDLLPYLTELDTKDS